MLFQASMRDADVETTRRHYKENMVPVTSTKAMRKIEKLFTAMRKIESQDLGTAVVDTNVGTTRRERKPVESLRPA